MIVQVDRRGKPPRKQLVQRVLIYFCEHSLKMSAFVVVKIKKKKANVNKMIRMRKKEAEGDMHN